MFQLRNYEGNYWIVPEGSGSYTINDSKYAVTMDGVNPTGINTVTFTYDFANKDSGTVKAGVFVNGYVYLNDDFKYGNFNENCCAFEPMRGADLDVFAVRMYSKVLTDEEKLQNHFADVALILKLDITDFNKLDNAGKAEVYKAFEQRSATDGKLVLQGLLDSVAKK